MAVLHQKSSRRLPLSLRQSHCGRSRQLNFRRWLWLAIATSIILIFAATNNTAAGALPPSLPPLEAHPLPPSLAAWQGAKQGDYFAQIESSPVGYLVWSEFPVKIYWERPLTAGTATASSQRFQQWSDAVGQAVAEWQAYLPLVSVSQRQLADITIERSPPPLGSQLNPETGKLEIPRARTAETRYEFYIRDGSRLLCHRMAIRLSPGLSQQATLAAARHELGHALGIWGHSPVETDALYFSQVGNTPPISQRDVNTLKKIYQQPTRLGWPLRE